MVPHGHTPTSIPPMISMHNVVVNGGNFTQHINVDGQKGRSLAASQSMILILAAAPFDILKDAVAHTAFHNSAARFDPPKCHPNTRVAVLNKILNWVQRRNRETRDLFVMWLTGAAGAGKSAIAQSFIELCLLQGLVIASFFFGKSDSTRNHAGSLIATLAYQICESVPVAKSEILSIIKSDPLILTRSLQHQFTQLVVKPLHTACYSGNLLPSGSYRVIVIDGLDECLDRETQQQILRIISNTARQFDLPILFLIASRPEHDIKYVFSSREMNGIHSRVHLDDTYSPDIDIRTFLRDRFHEIRITHPFRSMIPDLWPTFDTLESLVRKSSGQFIYPATVIRFIQSIRHQPHHRLDIVMNLRPVQADSPFAQLDAIYKLILSTAEDIERVLYALSIYSLGIVRDMKFHFDISQFMSLQPGELEILFCDLGALVELKTIRNQQDMLKVLHASLHDFLLDPMRSKEYFININNYRAQHLINILRYVALSGCYSHTIFAEFINASFQIMTQATSYHHSTDFLKRTMHSVKALRS